MIARLRVTGGNGELKGKNIGIQLIKYVPFGFNHCFLR